MLLTPTYNLDSAGVRKSSFAAPGQRDKLKSDVLICLDKDEASYSAGELVKGHVLVTLTSEIRLKEVIVKYFGAARVSWDERRSYTKGSSTVVSHKDTEIYLDHSTTIKHNQKSSIRTRRTSNCPEDESVVLPKGDHTFPFEYRLPTSIPGSYEGKWGHVKYFVRVALVRPWKFDIEREQEITVDGKVDLNDDQELAKPACGFVENPRGFLCIYSGWISAKLLLQRRGYTVGETVIFTAEVENMTPRKVANVRLALVQHVIFRINDRSKKVSTVIMSCDKGEIMPQSTNKWENENFCIPSLRPSTLHSCKAIQLRYTISVIIKPSTLEEIMTAPISIVLGTVSLQRRHAPSVDSLPVRNNASRRGSQAEVLSKAPQKSALQTAFLNHSVQETDTHVKKQQANRSSEASKQNNKRPSTAPNQPHSVIAHAAQVHSQTAV